MEQSKQMAQQEPITLSLKPQLEEEVVEEKQEEQELPEITLEEMYSSAGLNEQEVETVENFSKQIDVMDPELSLMYGVGAQKKINDFSETALHNVRTKDLGEVGTVMEDLTKELKKSQPKKEKKKGFLGFFKNKKDEVEELFADYDEIETNVDKITKILEQHQIALLKDIALMDELYERNENNAKELTMYIIAGKKRIKEIEEVELPAAMKKAQDTKKPEDVQAANDLAQALNRFEKKIYDLELTRQVAIQMAPQIRLLQNNDSVMVEKIQSTIVNTIPLWKNQIVLALGIDHSKKAMQAERSVNDMTNDLLKKNAETLHMAAVDTAKESERGIIDIETLQVTNEELIKSLDEVLQIQSEGRKKRKEAEAELVRIENELHNKLMQIDREKDVTKK